MSGERYSLDANLLFYAIGFNHPERHHRAEDISQRAALDHDCVIALQAYAEFIASTARKGKLSVVDAAAQIADWQALYTTVYPKSSTLSRAIRAVADHNLSFWDAMLWSTVKDAGTTVLLSEDFQDGRVLDGVLFRNPFTASDPFHREL